MSGDFGLVYDEYYKKIYNYAYYRLLNHHCAEDVTAEVFLKALENYSAFEGRGGASVSTWLFAIAKNAVNDYFRRLKKIVSIESEKLDEHIGTDENDLYSYEDRQRLRELLNELDERSREALSLRYWGEMSYAEIARNMGVSEKNAGVILSRAVEKIRKKFNSV